VTALTLSSLLVLASVRSPSQEPGPARSTQSEEVKAFRKTAISVSFPSDGRMLHGWLYKPQGLGEGPFPAVIWNHGSERRPIAHPELGQFYTRHGFVVFLPVRHGHEPSPGEYIQDALEAYRAGGKDEALVFKKLVELQDSYNRDVVAALAWLRDQPYVDRDRIVMTGCSYGGIQTLITAEKGLGVRAFVPFAPAAMSWANPELRRRMIETVEHAKAPLFLLQAENDYGLGPSEVLGPLIRGKGGLNRAKVYPPFGTTPQEGHGGFACREGGIAVWGDDVLEFLNAVGLGKPTVDSRAAPTVPQARKAIERSLAFLRTDAAQWRTEHQCATCHHGTMTVWALSEAKRAGYEVAGETWTDLVTWTKERLKDIDKPRDPRPGWNMVSTPAVYLAVMARTVPGQEALSRDELERIAGHLLRHQETDGSWAWSIAPPRNTPPPVFESDEVLTLLADLALGEQVPDPGTEASPVRASRARAAAWLATHSPSESTQATALRLLRDIRDGKPPAELTAQIDRLLSKQNHDGGWGQDKDLPSDAYATGQALYFLSLGGMNNSRNEIRRAVSFLVATQEDEGSWPMTSRAHPGEKPFTNPVPITYFGSAWATLGLLRSVPR
jgi:dienelactone hydrolase